MGILMKSRGKSLMQAMAQLEEADYGRESAEMAQIYDRLVAGRSRFEAVMSNLLIP